MNAVSCSPMGGAAEFPGEGLLCLNNGWQYIHFYPFLTLMHILLFALDHECTIWEAN